MAGNYAFIQAEFAIQLVMKNLKIIRSVKYLTSQFSNMLESMSGNVSDDLSNLSKLVPVPIKLDFKNPADVAACAGNPVFCQNAKENPTALIQQIDPNVLNIKASRQMRSCCTQYCQKYEQAFSELNSVDTLSVFRRYLKDMYRIMGNPMQFSAELPLSIGISMISKIQHPETYNDKNAPFKSFDIERKDFQFNGLTPSGLGNKSVGILEKLAAPELNLFGWMSLSVNCEKQP